MCTSIKRCNLVDCGTQRKRDNYESNFAHKVRKVRKTRGMNFFIWKTEEAKQGINRQQDAIKARHHDFVRQYLNRGRMMTRLGRFS